MLAETGILDAEQARRSPARSTPSTARSIRRQLAYTGEVEDFFFLIEKELKARLGPDRRRAPAHRPLAQRHRPHAVQARRSSSGSTRCWSRRGICCGALIDAAEREKATLIVAYTHGQPAQPSTFGHYLVGGHRGADRATSSGFEAARTIVDLSPMGAAAITTSGFPIDRQRVARASRLRGAAAEFLRLHRGGRLHHLDLFGDRADVPASRPPDPGLPVLDELRGRAGLCAERLRADLARSCRRSAIRCRSSICAMLASQTMGRARTVLDVIHNTPFTDMNDSEGETQAMGYEAFDRGWPRARSARRLRRLRSASIRSACAENIRRSCITITELADTLVRIEGLSFREAHEIAAAVAKAVVAAGGELAERRLCAVPRSLQACDRARAVLRPRHSSPRSSRPNISSPCATASAARRRRRWPRRLRVYSGQGCVLRRRTQDDNAEREATAAHELGEKFTALVGSALMATIELEELVKRYGKVDVVHGIDLDNRRRRVRRARRPLGLRQVDDAAHDRRPRGHLRRHARRSAARWSTSASPSSATSPWCSRTTRSIRT